MNVINCNAVCRKEIILSCHGLMKTCQCAEVPSGVSSLSDLQ